MFNTKFKLVALLLVLCTFAASGCDTGRRAENENYLSVRERTFVDGDGRTIILNGLNHVTKIPEKCYLSDNDEQLFRQFKAWGFNCIRFGIYWDGLEPEPGKINETYLQEIDKRVKWAEENNIWLILDMHQDLYSRKFGNGAPMWATLDEGLPHETGDVWSDAYLVSQAIHKSFDNFWNNAPAPDGTGIQDHYIQLWKTLAERYAHAPSVAGFDIMNEPFMGSSGQLVLPKLLEGYAGYQAKLTGKVMTETELAEMWGNETKRIEALSMLNDKTEYSHIVDNAYEPVREFEQGHLSDFYQKVRNAIRSVNKTQIIFLEHTYFCNLGITSSFHIPKDEGGKPDLLCAYAPHGYDLLTDTDGAEHPSYNRVEFIFDRIFGAGQDKNVPVIVGEWGAFYLGGKYEKPATHLIGLFEKALAGQTYWSYWDNIDKQDYFAKALSRHYPMATNGTLLNYRNDNDAGMFICQWEENNQTSSTIIYTPDIERAKGDGRVLVEPMSEIIFQPIGNSPGGYIEIKPLGQKRRVSIGL